MGIETAAGVGLAELFSGVTAEGVAQAAVLGAGAASAYGSIQQANAQADAQEANARNAAVIADAQGKADEQRATEERAMSIRRAEEKQLETDRLMARERAVSAASGGGTGGSAADIEAQSAGEGKFQSDVELWKGEERAKGAYFQTGLDRSAANQRVAMADWSGDNTRTAGYVTGGSQILGAAGNAASIRMKSSKPSSSNLVYDPDRPSSPRGTY